MTLPATHRCPKCGNEKYHPPMLRSIPYCDDCKTAMGKKIEKNAK